MKYIKYILIAFLIPGILWANSLNEIQNKISNISSEIAKINTEIIKYENQIAETSEEANNLSNLIKELNLTKNKLLKEKESTQKRITSTGYVINLLTNDISTKKESIELGKKVIAKLIKDLYLYDKESFIEKILNTKDLKEMSFEYNNAIQLNKELRLNIRDLQGIKEELITSKGEQELEEEKLQELKKQLTLKEKAVQVSKNEKNKILKETKNKEEAYQLLLKEQEEKRSAFERELFDYESQLEFVLNTGLLPEKRKALSWPLDKVLITQGFGLTPSSRKLYRSGRHSGVDFRASVGTSIRATSSGIVEGTGNTDKQCYRASFGKWVFIRHNNGLATAYGHLSEILVKEGDIVKKGDVIALSGNTGHSTGPHLHLSVYAGQGVSVKSIPSKSCQGRILTIPIAPTESYLDPLDYLPKTTRDMFKHGAIFDRL
ncbi:MAG: peptidoglycan DD-metalloendopeptidase family protein [Patescibacteria group bacterium]|nr:peptidoglycan DD-metalloendopeptidase family protein [Patescibacteria group bacterium]